MWNKIKKNAEASEKRLKDALKICWNDFIMQQSSGLSVSNIYIYIYRHTAACLITLQKMKLLGVRHDCKFRYSKMESCAIFFSFQSYFFFFMLCIRLSASPLYILSHALNVIIFKWFENCKLWSRNLHAIVFFFFSSVVVASPF